MPAWHTGPQVHMKAGLRAGIAQGKMQEVVSMFVARCHMLEQGGDSTRMLSITLFVVLVLIRSQNLSFGQSGETER